MASSTPYLISPEMEEATITALDDPTMNTPECACNLFVIIYILSYYNNVAARHLVRRTWGLRLDPNTNFRFIICQNTSGLDMESKEKLYKEATLYDDVVVYDLECNDYSNAALNLAALRHSNQYCPHVPFTYISSEDTILNWLAMKTVLTKYYFDGNNSTDKKSDYKDSEEEEDARLLSFKGSNKIFCTSTTENVDRTPGNPFYVPGDVYPNEKYPEFCSQAYVIGNGALVKILDNFDKIKPKISFRSILLTGIAREQVSPPIEIVNMGYHMDTVSKKYTDCEMQFLYAVKPDPNTPIFFEYFWQKILHSSLICPQEYR